MSMQAVPFWENVDDSAGPLACWPWTASRTTAGYGQTALDRRMFGAHRVAFFLANDFWPDQCRHTCDNPLCCNPLHLLDGTRADNMRDMVERGRHRTNGNDLKTHCKRGHPFSGDNLYVTSGGNRQCRACNREKSARYAERRRTAMKEGTK